MKIVILAGGYGTRLGEPTESVPKPMVTVGGIPIIIHIMNIYRKHGFTEFVIALGHKGQVIKKYFKDYAALNSDFKVDLRDGGIETLDGSASAPEWSVTLVDTGEATLTGGRLKRLSHLINTDTFMATYGDGVADINIGALVAHHKKERRKLTVTAVRPPARFGELHLQDNTVVDFAEKPQLNEGWINGGFFVVEPEFLDYIDGDHQMLEQEPFQRAVKDEQVTAFRHAGFWQCMDTKRDLETLERIYAAGKKW